MVILISFTLLQKVHIDSKNPIFNKVIYINELYNTYGLRVCLICTNLKTVDLEDSKFVFDSPNSAPLFL